MKTLAQRLEDKWMFETNSGCWLWTGKLTKQNYGCLHLGGRKAPYYKAAHRVSWEVYRGPLTDDIFVCHKCDTPSCIRPDHLFLGTQADNMQDCARKGRTTRGRLIECLSGLNNYNARLSAENVVAIRASKIGPTALAKQFGVSRTHIKRIRAYKSRLLN